MSKPTIAKKARPVKGQKPQKTVTAPRYKLKKDSLGRRYAVDKTTGKRVSVSKAEQERVKRRKAAAKTREQEIFRGIERPRVSPKLKSQSKKSRSEAAKRGWETRRKNLLVPFQVSDEERIQLGRQIGAFAIPDGMRMHIVGGAADRSSIYPKVKEAADYAFARVQADFYNRQVALLERRPLPTTTTTPKFDRHFGVGMGQLVRDRLAGAVDLADIDQIIEQMADDPDYDFTTRELYTLYFSPEVA